MLYVPRFVVCSLNVVMRLEEADLIEFDLDAVRSGFDTLETISFNQL